MKKVLLSSFFLCAVASALGQGKVSLQMDQPLTLGSWPDILSGDIGLSGQPIPTTGPLPSGVSLAVGLYAGTSSSSLGLVSSTILNPVGGTLQPPGIISVTHIILPFFGGSLAYFQVKVWDSAYASYESQFAAGHYLDDYSAWSSMFTMTPGTGVAYPSIINGGGSSWVAVGNENAPSLLVRTHFPEPRTLAFVGLGAAVLLMRKWARHSGDF